VPSSGVVQVGQFGNDTFRLRATAAAHPATAQSGAAFASASAAPKRKHETALSGDDDGGGDDNLDTQEFSRLAAAFGDSQHTPASEAEYASPAPPQIGKRTLRMALPVSNGFFGMINGNICGRKWRHRI
jgi:hypothetical protein